MSEYVCPSCRKMIEADVDGIVWCLDCKADNGKGHPAMKELKGTYE